MDLCMNLEPHRLRVAVDHVLVTASINPKEATRLGEALLGRIDWAGHPQESLTLLRALAEAALRQYDFARCMEHCDHAEDHLHADKDYDTYRNFVFFRFVVAMQQGRVHAAREIGQSWVERARSRADSLDLMGALSNLAILEVMMGDWPTGKDLMEEAILLSRQFKLWVSLAANLSNLATSLGWRGRVKESYALNKEALTHVGPVGKDLPILCNLYTDAWNLADDEAALDFVARIKAQVNAPCPLEVSHHSHVIDAQMRFGDAALAGRQARESIDRILQIPGIHQAMGVYLTAQIAAGSLEDAASIMAQISKDYEVSSPSVAHANYLLATAQLAYARGEDRAAHGILARYVANRGGLVSSFKGGTDLMWLAMDMRRVDEALDMSVEVADHLSETLRGQCVAARMHFEQRRFDRAVEQQRAVVHLASRRRVLPYLKQLLSHYESAAAGQTRKKLARAPLLPSAF